VLFFQTNLIWQCWRQNGNTGCKKHVDPQEKPALTLAQIIIQKMIQLAACEIRSVLLFSEPTKECVFNADALGDMLPYAGGADHMAFTSGGRAVGATSAAKMGNKCQALRSLAVTAIECVLPTVPELGSSPSVRILYTAITERMGAQFYQV
jgi:hypothetical protein